MIKSKKNKHMVLDDRIEIQECLNKGITFRAIAQRICKDPTTVSKEVKLHSRTYTNSSVKTDECCPKLLKAPFVCNGCPKRNHSNCQYPRRPYVAKEAQAEYETLLTESREGIPLNKEEFYETERTISCAVQAGQRIYHAIQANNLAVSKSTVYRHIAKGYYSISPIDHPEGCKIQAAQARFYFGNSPRFFSNLINLYGSRNGSRSRGRRRGNLLLLRCNPVYSMIWPQKSNSGAASSR